MTFDTSVAICTYNGEKYIREQLETIKKQSKFVDEVIICDDCSTDNTYNIINEYISENNLQNTWNLHKNVTNIGYKKNFHNAIDLCTKKYIFLCDQDDLWETDKIAQMSSYMEINPEVNLLASNYTILDSGNNSEYRVQNTNFVNDGYVKKVLFDEKWAYIKRIGCTYCIRKQFYDNIKQYWNDEYPHDAILWRFANIHNSLAILQSPMLKYRRHSNNVSGKKQKNLSERLSVIEYYIEFFLFFKKYTYEIGDIQKSDIINRGLNFLYLREKLLKNHSILLWLKLFFYQKHYSSYLSWFADLYYCVK
ncbi:MAG: glycosyltransferase [Bacteroidales bacterium]|nr:glycosyltransferase [Bacteroidales bacterium]